MNHVRSTSAASYSKNIAPILSALRDKIIQYLEMQGAASSRMIAEGIGISTATCSGVLTRMKGVSVVEMPMKYPCAITGNTVIYVKLKR